MKLSKAKHYRGVIEQTVQSADDTTALTVVSLHPGWAAGTEYTLGRKVQRGGKLWRCVTAHMAQEGWEPENTPALWEQINETNAGTLADPIPYSSGMALTAGLYYTQNGAVYLCTRDTVNPVYAPLTELTGIYVETVQ